jgi:hypothetical protein
LDKPKPEKETGYAGAMPDSQSFVRVQVDTLPPHL